VEANGVYSMKSFPNGVVIAPRGTLELAPGGYHAMMVGLKTSTSEGQTIPATLTFRRLNRVETVRVAFTVQIAPPEPVTKAKVP